MTHFVRCKRCGGKAQMFQDGQYPKAGCLEENCTWTYIVPFEILEEFIEANKYEEATMPEMKRNVVLWSATLAAVGAGIGYAVGGALGAALGGGMGGFLGALLALR